MSDDPKSATDHLLYHAGLCSDLLRRHQELHRKMEDHGRAINEARDMSNPLVHPPGE